MSLAVCFGVCSRCARQSLRACWPQFGALCGTGGRQLDASSDATMPPTDAYWDAQVTQKIVLNTTLTVQRSERLPHDTCVYLTLNVSGFKISCLQTQGLPRMPFWCVHRSWSMRLFPQRTNFDTADVPPSRSLPMLSCNSARWQRKGTRPVQRS